MNRLWAWVSDNSAALQGLVALILVVSALLAMPSFVGKLFRPDVLLRYRAVETTIPRDLSEWLNQIHREVSWRPSLDLGEENADLAEILSNPVSKKLGDVGANVEKLVLELTNQSDAAVSGAKLRVEGVLQLWGADAKGTFLTTPESTNLLDAVAKGYSNDSVILSSLPTLPPDASLEVVLYGTINKHSEPTLNIVGHTSDVRKIQSVEESWFIELYQSPWKLLIWIPVPAYVAMILFFAYLRRLRRISVKQALPTTLYNTGCKLAKQGRAEDAMVLLRQAVESGYTNRTHAKQDVDLESLRSRDDFRELFSEPKDET